MKINIAADDWEGNAVYVCVCVVSFSFRPQTAFFILLLWFRYKCEEHFEYVSSKAWNIRNHSEKGSFQQRITVTAIAVGLGFIVSFGNY